jgi:hypothetical protein
VIISEIKINNENFNYIVKEEYYSYGIILPQKLNFIVNYEKKIYDGTTKINIKLISEVCIDYKYAEFEDKNIGNNKKITIYGLKVNNKNFYIDDTYASYGDILPLQLKLVFDNPKKIYDKTTNINVNILETNIIINDDVKILSDFKAEFCDSNASLNKDKTNIVPINFAISQTEEEFYYISSEASFCNGGISLTTKSKAEIMEKSLNSSMLGEVHNLEISKSLPENKPGQQGVFVATQQASGAFTLHLVTNSASAVNQALAACYAVKKAEILKKAKELDIASNDAVITDSINQAASK